MKARLLIVGALLLAPGAVAQTVAKKLAGEWSCTADFGYEVQTWLTKYLDGGRMVSIDEDPSYKLAIYDTDDLAPGEKPPEPVAMPNERTMEGEWRIRKDGQLVEQLKRIIDVSIRINGRKRSIGMPRDLETNEIDARELVSSLSFKSNGSFVATASDGIVTTCTPKKSK